MDIGNPIPAPPRAHNPEPKVVNPIKSGEVFTNDSQHQNNYTLGHYQQVAAAFKSQGKQVSKLENMQQFAMYNSNQSERKKMKRKKKTKAEEKLDGFMIKNKIRRLLNWLGKRDRG